MSDEDDDRRRAERIAINDEFGRLPEATYISDLSEYGVFVQTRHPPRLGAVVALRFTVLLDDPVVIEANGRVVRHSRDPRGMGIEFTDLPAETLLRINDIMAQQRPHASGSTLPAPVDAFDNAQTRARGQIPVQSGARHVRPARARGADDVDERATSRYPALGSMDAVAGEVLGTGEYEVVDEAIGSEEDSGDAQ